MNILKIIKNYIVDTFQSGSQHSKETEKWSGLLDCLDELKLWMASSFLRLNESKSEVLIFGPSKLANQLSLDLSPLASNVNTQVRNLAVIFDSEMKCCGKG